jgi:hypothetical protein
VYARPSETGRGKRAYFFFRRFVVFFFATRFAFFFVFFFAAIGMSIDSFDPQHCPGRRLSTSQNVNNMRGLHFGMQYCLRFAKVRENADTQKDQYL